MKQTKCLKGVCAECSGPIEFPAEMVGTMAQCPRCKRQTELRLAPPTEEPTISRRVMVYTIIATVLLIAGLVAVVVGLKHFEKLAAKQKQKAAGAETIAATNAPGLEKR